MNKFKATETSLLDYGATFSATLMLEYFIRSPLAQLFSKCPNLSTQTREEFGMYSAALLTTAAYGAYRYCRHHRRAPASTLG